MGDADDTYIARSGVARKVHTSIDRVHHADGVEFGLEVLQAGTEQVGGCVDYLSALRAHSGYYVRTEQMTRQATDNGTY